MPLNIARFVDASPIGAIIPPLLLVSVKSAAEAGVALAAGVGWIDLKNPDAGSLGAPTLETTAEVGLLLSAFPNRSIALGELPALEESAARGLCQYFPVAKVGLAGCRRDGNLASKFIQLGQSLNRKRSSLSGTQLVPVLYADCADCDAPSADVVIELARATAAPYLLVDTHCKDGRRLSDWMSQEELREVIEAARAAGIQTVLAGSLQIGDVPQLRELRPAAIAVRGAVCDGQRTNAISSERLKQWIELFASANS